MTNEEVNRAIMRAEAEYEKMKDNLVDLSLENAKLKARMNEMAYTKVYIKREELNWIKQYFDKDLISIDDLIAYIEDLHADLDRLQEKYDDLQEDLETNYRRKRVEEEI